MTTHEYLRQASRMDGSIKGRAREMERLREIAYSISGIDLDSDRARGGGAGSRLENAVTKLVDYERELGAEMLAMIDLGNTIKGQIRLLEDPRQRDVLYGIYVCGRSKSGQAREMGVSFKTVSRIYRAAMRRFEEMHGEEYRGREPLF